MKLTFLINDEGIKRRLDVDSTQIKIGTTDPSALKFNDKRVARIHAIIEQDSNNKPRIVDLGSAYGVVLKHMTEQAGGRTIRMAPVNTLDVIQISPQSYFQVWETEVFERPSLIEVRTPPGRMRTDELREEIFRLNTALDLYSGEEFQHAVKARKARCEHELFNNSTEVPLNEHPYRALHVEVAKPATKTTFPTNWEVNSLKQRLEAMTKDRDGWQIEAERLADVVADRDREIEALKSQIQGAKEGWHHR